MCGGFRRRRERIFVIGWCPRWNAGWGLSPQRPIRRAYEQKLRAIRIRLTETHPAIVATAKAEGGIVLWLDESGISSTAELGTTWAITGNIPVLPKTGQRFRANLMAAISNRGKLHFTVYTGSLTVELYPRFLDRLAHAAGESSFTYALQGRGNPVKESINANPPAKARFRGIEGAR
jgi:hypothetical protein